MPLVPKVSACLASTGAKGVEGAVELPGRLNDWELVTRQFAFKAAHEVGVQGAQGVQGVRRSLGRVRQLVMEGWQGEYRGLLIGEKLRGGFLTTPYTKHTPSQKWTFCLVVFSSPSSTEHTPIQKGTKTKDNPSIKHASKRYNRTYWTRKKFFSRQAHLKVSVKHSKGRWVRLPGRQAVSDVWLVWYVMVLCEMPWNYKVWYCKFLYAGVYITVCVRV